MNRRRYCRLHRLPPPPQAAKRRKNARRQNWRAIITALIQVGRRKADGLKLRVDCGAPERSWMPAALNYKIGAIR